MKTIHVSDEVYQMLARKSAAANYSSVEEYLAVLGEPVTQRQPRPRFSWTEIEKIIDLDFPDATSARYRWKWFLDLLATKAPHQLQLGVGLRVARDAPPLLIEAKGAGDDSRYEALSSGGLLALTAFSTLQEMHEAAESLALAVGFPSKLITKRLRKTDWRHDKLSDEYVV
jgi:hypothetical protein